MPDLGTVRLSGDLAFIAKKEFDGKIRTNEGVVTTNANVATLTATTGKDMYLATAKCSVKGTSISAVAEVDVELLINGVVHETFIYRSNYGTGGSVSKNTFDCQAYEFKNIGQKVAAGQIIKLQTVAISNCEVEGYLECWEESTGTDPTVI